MKPTVTIDINTKGDVAIDVEGATGMSCVDLTARIEQALGHQYTRESKPEMHQHDQQQQHTGADHNL